MHPVLFHVFGFPVNTYGLMLVIGVLAAVQVCKFLALRSKVDPEIFANAAMIALFTGIVGARASHVLENWSDYTRGGFAENLKQMINLTEGGLTYYGGVILAFPCTLLYGVYKKVSLRLGMDIVAPALVLALGIGRIGCLMYGCCFGARCELPWAITFPYGSPAFMDQYHERILPPPNSTAAYDLIDDNGRLIDRAKVDKSPTLSKVAAGWRSLPLHPAQVYSTITSLFIFFILMSYFTLPHAPGRVMAMMFLLEGPSRFLLEMLRAEPPVWGPMSLSMVIGAIFGILGIVLWFAFGFWDKSHDRPEGFEVVPT